MDELQLENSCDAAMFVQITRRATLSEIGSDRVNLHV